MTSVTVTLTAGEAAACCDALALFRAANPLPDGAGLYAATARETDSARRCLLEAMRGLGPDLDEFEERSVEVR